MDCVLTYAAAAAMLLQLLSSSSGALLLLAAAAVGSGGGGGGGGHYELLYKNDGNKEHDRCLSGQAPNCTIFTTHACTETAKRSS